MTADALTLDVADRPTVEAGDTLLVTPDVGRPYRATVLRVETGRARVRIPPSGEGPVPTLGRTTWFTVCELTDFYAMGDLMLNPPEQYREAPA